MGSLPSLLFSFTFLTNSSGSSALPINFPLKKTSVSPVPILSSPSDSKSFMNLTSSRFTLEETLLKIARFFLKPISVPSGVSIGQNLP